MHRNNQRRHAFPIHQHPLCLGKRPLDLPRAPPHKIEARTSVGHTFTTQKNSVRNEKIAHGHSGHDLCNPVTAAMCQILHLRQHKVTSSIPIASCFSKTQQTCCHQGQKRHRSTTHNSSCQPMGHWPSPQQRFRPLFAGRRRHGSPLWQH